MTTEGATALIDLVGDGKKFATAEDLAKGKIEADRFIAQLQSETATLRDELQKALEKVNSTSALETLVTNLQNKNTTESAQTETKPATSADNQTALGLSQEDVVKLIEAREAAKAQQRNYDTSMAQVNKVYGDKAKEFLETRARELGLEVSTLETLARTSPQAFVNAVGVSQRDASTRSMSTTSVNSEGLNPDSFSNVRNKTYYDAKMKEMGAAKFILDRTVQIQMYKDMDVLGDSFFQ